MPDSSVTVTFHRGHDADATADVTDVHAAVASAAVIDGSAVGSLASDGPSP